MSKEPPVWVSLFKDAIERHFPKEKYRGAQNAQVCVRLGISNITLLQWKADRRRPSRQFILKLSEFMDLPAERLLYLLSEGENKVPE